jgi:hypothetical protein
MKRGQKNKVYKLNKTLYSLKQASRAYYTRIDSYFPENGFHKCPYEHILYIKTTSSGDIIIVCLYMDDLIFTSNNLWLMIKFKEAMIA